MIPIERFAQLQAAIELVPEPGGVFAGAGIGDDDWRQIVKHYLSAFDTEMHAGRSELGVRYLDAYFGAIEGHRSPAPPARPPSAETGEVDVNRAREGMRARGVPFRPPIDDPPLRPAFPVPDADLAPPLAEDAEPSPDTIVSVEQAAARSLPFEHAADLMGLERYAEMAAELRVRPAEASAIMARFGLATHEQRERVHTLWRRRFEANPALFARFTDAVEQKSAALQSHPPDEK